MTSEQEREAWDHPRVRVVSVRHLTDSVGGSVVPIGERGWATPDHGIWRVTFDNGQKYSVDATMSPTRRPIRAMGTRHQPHFPTMAELAHQRAEFALDSVESRPYHFLSRARAARGMPWNKEMGKTPMLREARRYTDRDEWARLQRVYATEEPFERTRGQRREDVGKWIEALRRPSREFSEV